MTIGQWLDSFLASLTSGKAVPNGTPTTVAPGGSAGAPASATYINNGDSYAPTPTLDVPDAPQGLQNIDPASSVMDQTSMTTPSQPSLRFPFRPINPPRVDNKDQPWYGRGPRFSGPAGFLSYDPIVQSPQGAPIGKVAQFWQHLNDYWGPDGQGMLDYNQEVTDQASADAAAQATAAAQTAQDETPN